MNKLDKKKIEKKVNAYIKSNEIKDENGVITGNSVLTVTPETLLNFFTSGTISGLSRKESLYAKHYFKSKLPFAEYKRSRGKDKELRIADIKHFQELMEGGNI